MHFGCTDIGYIHWHWLYWHRVHTLHWHWLHWHRVDIGCIDIGYIHWHWLHWHRVHTLTLAALTSGTYIDIGCIDIRYIHWHWLHWHWLYIDISCIGCIDIDIGCIGCIDSIDIGCIDIGCIDIGYIDIGISSIRIVIESMAALVLEVRTGIRSFSWFASYTMWKAPLMSSVVLFTTLSNTLILSQSTWWWWFSASCRCWLPGRLDVVSSVHLSHVLSHWSCHVREQMLFASDSSVGSAAVLGLLAVLYVSGYLLPSMTSLRCSSPVTVVTPWTTVCACERGALSQAQTVVQGVTTVTGEELLREVMDGNRYPDTCSTGLASSLCRCVWIPVTFHDFSEVFFSCYCGHILNDSLCLWKGASFTGHKLSFRVWPW